MILSQFQKIMLGVSGIVALGIGLSILSVPHAFYAGYGITLGNDPDLLSEFRAPAAGLAALGAVMLAGIMRAELRQMSVMAALIVFLAFPAGRMIGLLTDGLPSGSVIGALVVEMVIGALCLAAFGRRSRADRTTGQPGAAPGKHASPDVGRAL